MGVGFVLVLGFFAIAFCGFVAGTIFLLGALIFCGKENRSRKLIFAFFLPGTTFALWAFFMLAGSIAIACKYHVDPGIGDNFSVPLKNDYGLMFIDSTEKGFIDRNNFSDGVPLIPGVVELAEIDDFVCGKIELRENDFEYFLFDMKSQQLEKFPSRESFSEAFPRVPENFVPASEFYRSRWLAIAQTPFLLLLILAPILTFFVIFTLGRLFLRQRK